MVARPSGESPPDGDGLTVEDAEPVPDDADDTSQSDGEGDEASGEDERAGRWVPMAEAPIESRAGHVAVWTGEYMAVWGGGVPDPLQAPDPGYSDPTQTESGNDTDDHANLYADGALYDPASDQWRALSTPPVPVASSAAVVWSDSELLFVDHEHAAAYDPAHHTWRVLTTPPSGQWRWSTAVWTGDDLVLLGAVDAADSASVAAVAYSPGDDTWRRLADPPLATVGPFTFTTSLRGEFVAYGDGGEQAVITAYQPGQDRWTDPAHAPAQPDSGRHVRGIAGHEAPQAEDDEVVVAGARYNGEWVPLTGAWRRDSGWQRMALSNPDALIARDLELVAEGRVMWIPRSVGGGLARTPSGWEPTTGGPVAQRYGSSAVWADDELIVWGGVSDDGVDGVAGARWRPTHRLAERADLPDAEYEHTLGGWP